MTYKPKPKWNQYRRRSSCLKKLGFASYAEYLASDLWQSVRTRVLIRDKGVCRGCGGRANQVHHKKYTMKAMTGTNLCSLISVCRGCHREAEFEGGVKVATSKANARILDIRREQRKKEMGWAATYIENLQAGQTVQFRPRGQSMSGKIESGQLCTVVPVTDLISVIEGDIVLCRVKGCDFLHLVKAVQGERYQIGNNKGHVNGWVGRQAIFGRCVRVE